MSDPDFRIRICRFCKKEFKVPKRNGKSSNNRQYCSYSCARKAAYHYKKNWDVTHPERVAEYRKKQHDRPTRVIEERIAKIEACGGKCVVCGINDPLFLQIHYVEGIEGYGWRHPRHLAWIREHSKEFIVLCANHHQELTITNKIRGWNP